MIWSVIDIQIIESPLLSLSTRRPFGTTFATRSPVLYSAEQWRAASERAHNNRCEIDSHNGILLYALDWRTQWLRSLRYGCGTRVDVRCTSTMGSTTVLLEMNFRDENWKLGGHGVVGVCVLYVIGLPSLSAGPVSHEGIFKIDSDVIRCSGRIRKKIISD